MIILRYKILYLIKIVLIILKIVSNIILLYNFLKYFAINLVILY